MPGSPLESPKSSTTLSPVLDTSLGGGAATTNCCQKPGEEPFILRKARLTNFKFKNAVKRLPESLFFYSNLAT
ncbi:MAG: hypothetical protein IPK95_10690 [Cellvibrionales bacterium]|nr:hypothetical protein [Cellvibrionales bacterium]